MPGGPRTIVAVVERGGIEDRTVTVARYVAPDPPLPGGVRGLRVSRSGDVLSVRWRPSVRSDTYLVRVTLPGGALLQTATTLPSARIGGVSALLAARVSVQGMLQGRRGAAAWVIVPARHLKPPPRITGVDV
jgi:hypothetical protein